MKKPSLLTAISIITLALLSNNARAALKLSPSQLEAWENVGIELKLNLSGLPKDETVTYVSSNEKVARVSTDGIVIPVAPGSCEITANTSSEKSNPVEVKITQKVVRDPKQKLTLGGTKKQRFDPKDLYAWPKEYGKGHVAVWRKDATGALSVTADDNLFWNFPRWEEYRKRYGIPVTLFVATKQAGKSVGIWKDMLAKGHSVQSHTKTHPSKNAYKNELTSAEIWMDYLQSHREIEDLLPNRSLTIAYSWGVNYPEMTSQLFIAGRGTVGLPNHPSRINWNNINSYSLGCKDDLTAQIASTYDSQYKIWNKTAVGSWTVLLYHNIDKDQDGSGLDKGLALAQKAVAERKLWADTFENVARYGQERDTAKLTFTLATPDTIEFSITDEMDDSLFDYPLTIKVRVDETWNQAKATQNGVERSVEMITREDGRYILVDAVPDRGTVRLNRIAQ